MMMMLFDGNRLDLYRATVSKHCTVLCCTVRKGLLQKSLRNADDLIHPIQVGVRFILVPPTVLAGGNGQRTKQKRSTFKFFLDYPLTEILIL